MPAKNSVSWKAREAPSDSPVMRGRGNNLLRLLDRYAGIPLVAASGVLRKSRTVPASPRSLGLIATAAIGDTILMSAIAADLREAFPAARILFFCGPSNAEVAALIPGLDTVIELPIFNPLIAARRVRQEKLDIVLDLGPWSRINALLTLCSRAAFTAGFDTAGQYRHYGYDLAIPHGSEVHELENYRRLVQPLGVRSRHIPELKTRSAGEIDSVPAEGFVVFHLWPGGTRAVLKQWPVPRWVALAEVLTTQGLIVLTGSAGQHALNQRVIDTMPAQLAAKVRNVAGLSLTDTAQLLSRARLVVSIDTGIMHLAAAVQAPLVALLGPTSRKRWGPVGSGAVVVESRRPGCGYLNLGFEPGEAVPMCMEAITVAEVLAGCHAALEIGADTQARKSEGPMPAFR